MRFLVFFLFLLLLSSHNDALSIRQRITREQALLQLTTSRPQALGQGNSDRNTAQSNNDGLQSRGRQQQGDAKESRDANGNIDQSRGGQQLGNAGQQQNRDDQQGPGRNSQNGGGGRDNNQGNSGFGGLGNAPRGSVNSGNVGGGATGQPQGRDQVVQGRGQAQHGH